MSDQPSEGEELLADPDFLTSLQQLRRGEGVVRIDPDAEATLVSGGLDLPVERPTRERLDRLNALTDQDPTWERE
jgi:hypothetical protein